MEKMRKIILWSVLILGLLWVYPVWGQDSLSGGIEKELQEQLSEVKEALARQAQEKRIMAEAMGHNLEIASKIIDWSGMFFALLAIVLILAGAIGLREFANIRKIEMEMKSTNQQMKTEFADIQKMRSEIQGEINLLKESVKHDARKFLRIIYLLNEGISSYNSGHLVDAIDLFLQVKRINPNDYEAICFLANAYMGQENYPLAIETAKQAIELVDQPAQAFSILGIAYRRIRKYDKAIEALKKSAELKRKPFTLVSLGLTYFHKGEYENAVRTFRSSLDLKRNSSAACGLAKSLTGKASVADARAYYQETLLLAKEEIARGVGKVFPYYNLAFAYFVENDPEACIHILDIALEKNKNPALIKEQMIDYQMMRDKSDLPQELLTRCVQYLNNALKMIKEAVI